jgi:phytoene dehydrogenase-like protein
MGKKVVIIGAGIAGLSAGCYLRINGYDTEMFELHDKPGGVCTSWERKGYTFDGCIHWLVGTKDGSSFNRAWRELGALPGPRIVNHEEFIRIEGKDGRQLIIYNDPDRLEGHLKEMSSYDDEAIEDLCDTIRKLQGIRTPLGAPQSKEERIEFLKMLPGLTRLLVIYLRNRKVTMETFCERLKEPFLRDTFSRLFEVPDFPMIWMLSNLAWISAGDAGYPEGGSLAFARSIERRYRELGGEVTYGSRVAEITVSGGRATGIRLEDGTEHKADIVISAADGHSTIFDMLGGAFVNDQISEMYDSWPLFDPIVQVSIGVARDLSSEPHALQLPLEKPIVVGGRKHNNLGYTHFCFDPTLAPEGKSAVVVYLSTKYD